MLYSVNIEELQRQVSELLEANNRLITEIQHLRCVMVEAATSVSPVDEPTLFSQLSGNPECFVTSDNNPYPEHENHVNEQYLSVVTYEAQKNGYY
jgi:regulator of replication initiation timing